MNTTINISLNRSMYEDARKLLKTRGFASISEVIRAALRDYLYPPRLTGNGFTPEFEDLVLESAKEPIEKSKEWKSVDDINDYFKNLKKKIVSHDKNKTDR